MDTLKKYIDDGTLVVKSGQTKIEQVAIAALGPGDGPEAHGGPADLHLQRRHQGPRRALALRRPVPRHHHRPAERRLRPDHHATPLLPIVTGQDAEIASVKFIADGVQSSTIFKDTRLLAEQAVKAAVAYLQGKTPKANDTKTYDNGSEGRPLLPAARRHGLQGRHPEGARSTPVTTPPTRSPRVRPADLARPAGPGGDHVPGPAAPPARPHARRRGPTTRTHRRAPRHPAPASRRGRRSPWPTTSWRCAPSPRPSPA